MEENEKLFNIIVDEPRREFLKRVYQLIVISGASSFFGVGDLLAMEKPNAIKPNILWLHGTSCSGCSTSFLNVEQVSVLDVLTKYSNLLFHPDISLATGESVLKLLEDSAKSKEKYIFVFEGSIPTKAPHACILGDKPLTYWIELLGKNAIASVAAGTCAVFGGITNMSSWQDEVVGPMSLFDFYQMNKIASPVVNLPNCPMKPEHLIYVLFHYIKLGTLPKMDGKNRPLRFFSNYIHERCTLYHDFQEKNFAKKIGDEGCLKELGCQGPVTKNDCLIYGHNGNTNICIKAGHPCIGCSSEHFPRDFMLHSYMDKRVRAKTFSLD